jgi:8-oxo-dGTP pyrophosphatase MutT (NUDIX family)
MLSASIHPAATVVMLRDSPKGFEVFLLKRHGQSDVLGGVYVFPGGKVDQADMTVELNTLLDQAPDQLHQNLGSGCLDASSATGFYVAALRETFEESGVLFAPGSSIEVTHQAATLHQQGLPFQAILKQLTLRLNTLSLSVWTRWVTPKGAALSKKRFDTWFFLARLPDEQTAIHDSVEATESIWLSPKEALQQFEQGRIELAAPQIMSLLHLAQHSSTSSVLAEAASRNPPTIEPEVFEQAQGRVFCYPGDPLHSVAQRALPGPTRLLYRNQRFELGEGITALLD